MAAQSLPPPPKQAAPRLHMVALLPAAPHAAEWEALEEGHDSKCYLPLTHLENWVHHLYFLRYLGLVLLMLFADQAPAVPSAR